MPLPNVLYRFKRGVDRGEKRSRRFGPVGLPAEQPPYVPIPEAPPQAGYYFTSWSEPRDAWMPERGRIPRLFNPNITMLAGLSSMDAANQTGHNVFLPPMEPMQRGGQVRAMSGGKNRAGGGSMSSGMARIPGVYVPVGRR